MELRLLLRSDDAGPAGAGSDGAADLAATVEPAASRPGSTVDIGSPGAAETLQDWYRPPRDAWLRINMIAAVSGDAAGSDGTSDTLSNPADRTILKAVREVSDAVVVGAASVRAEGYRVPSRAQLAVVTASGDLSGLVIADDQAARVLVLCPAAAVDAVHASLGPAAAADAAVVVVADVDGRVMPHDIVAALHARGLTSLICEGGPSLAGQLVEAGLVDELCLTTSPVVIGSGLPAFGTERFGAQRLRLTQLVIDDASGLYARWRVEGH